MTLLFFEVLVVFQCFPVSAPTKTVLSEKTVGQGVLCDFWFSLCSVGFYHLTFYVRVVKGIDVHSHAHAVFGDLCMRTRDETEVEA